MMTGYRATRGRGSGSRKRSWSSNRGRTSSGSQSLGRMGDEANSLSNIHNDIEQESASPVEESTVNRRGPNHGIPLPSSPGRHVTISVRSRNGFDNHKVSREGA